MIMKFLLKYGYEFGMNSGPQGEMGFTKIYYHNGSEVLWVTINPNTYKAYFYNEYDCGGLLNKWTVYIPKSIRYDEDAFISWLKEQIYGE